MSRLPAATSAPTAAEKSLRIGYISRVSPTRTIETPPDWSVFTFIGSLPCASMTAHRAVVTAAQLLDLACQLRPSAIDARFDGSFRQPERVGNLLVRQFLD